MPTSATTSNNADRLAFHCDFYDRQADLFRPYVLLFYPADSAVEMYDQKLRRTFLRRTRCSQVAMRELVPGRSVLLFGRSLLLVACADAYTANFFAAIPKPSTVSVLWPAPDTASIARIFDAAKNFSFAKLLANRDMLLRCPEPEAPAAQCTRIADDAQFALLRDAAASSPPSQTPHGASVLVIKPHALIHASKIIGMLADAGFAVEALQTLSLSLADAHDFYDVYRGVLPEYSNLADELASGPCLALKVSREGAVLRLRELCGPYDPKVATSLFPNTLRAKFGSDRVRNAVHCTDIQEDVAWEVKFFFEIIGS